MDQLVQDYLKKMKIDVCQRQEYKLPSLPISVRVSVSCKQDPKIESLLFKKVTKSGGEICAYDFESKDGLFTFFVTQECHESFVRTYVPKYEEYICSTFIDLCTAYVDKTTETSAKECTTPIPPGVLGSLKWALPGEFGDNVIDILGELNAVLFDGILEDSFLQGPIFGG